MTKLYEMFVLNKFILYIELTSNNNNITIEIYVRI